MQAEAARQQSHGNYGKMGQTMHPPNMRMPNHLNPNVSKPQHAAGINVGGPNPNANMMANDWNNGPRFSNPNVNNPNAMRSPNPGAQMVAPNQMQGNPVSFLISDQSDLDTSF